MSVYLLLVEIVIFNSHSLKEKRIVLKSLKDKLVSKFKLSVSELDFQDKWQKARLGMVTINTDRQINEKLINHVEDFLSNDGRFDIVYIKKEELV